MRDKPASTPGRRHFDGQIERGFGGHGIPSLGAALFRAAALHESGFAGLRSPSLVADDVPAAGSYGNGDRLNRRSRTLPPRRSRRGWGHRKEGDAKGEQNKQQAARIRPHLPSALRHEGYCTTKVRAVAPWFEAPLPKSVGKQLRGEAKSYISNKIGLARPTKKGFPDTISGMRSDSPFHVSVFGSAPDHLLTEQSEEWSEAAFTLGEIIVESGATLVVSSEATRTVDYHAVQGAVAAAKRGRNVSIQVHTYQPEPAGSRVPYQDLRDIHDTPDLAVEFVFYERLARTSGPRPLHVGQITTSNCIVFLGGRPGLIVTAEYALARGLSVVAFSAYGGMARTLAERLPLPEDLSKEFSKPIQKSIHLPLLKWLLTGTTERTERVTTADAMARFEVQPAEPHNRLIADEWTRRYGGSIVDTKVKEPLVELHWSGGRVGDVLRGIEDGTLAEGFDAISPGARLDELWAGGERLYTYTPMIALREVFDFESVGESEIKTLQAAVKVLIIVATDTEKRVALDNLQPLSGKQRIVEVFTGRRTYYFGKLGRYNVALTDCSMGTGGRQGSLITCVRAIEDIRPEAIFMVGIAFGMDRNKQQLGDVLVAEAIFPYEIARIGSTTQSRSNSVDCDLDLASLLQSAAFNWNLRVGLRRVATHRGLVLSGEKLVANKEFKDQLMKAFPLAKGGEMEGAGVYWAAVEGKVPAILVKAICDWADSSKNDVAQPFAALAAVSFLGAALSKPSALRAFNVPEAP